MTAPWTRLEDGPLWKAAEAAYTANGLAYHNLDHVRRLYGHAARHDLVYDAALDRAILFHDAILDGAPEPERRSADFLEDVVGPDPEARALILTTVHHHPGGDDRLALLDLLDFADCAARTQGTVLREEAASRGMGEEEWREKTCAYLEGLVLRIESGSGRSERSDLWREILGGVTAVLSALSCENQQSPAAG